MEQAVRRYLSEAKLNLDNENFGKAYAFYLLVLKLNPDVKNAIKDDFARTWKGWSRELMRLKRNEDLFSMYEQGCEAFGECDGLHLHMSFCIDEMGMRFESVGLLRKTLLINEHNQDALLNLDLACRGLVDSWHFAMLNDKRRNELFNEAIKDALNAMDWDDCILDIGSGTGLLGMFAVRNGAAKVHCCEMSEVMHSVAEECIEENDLKSKVVPIHLDSLKLTVGPGKTQIPQRATLVISEIVDAGLLGEGVVDSLHHAWEHLLIPPKDGGVVVPHSASVYCMLVESETIWNKHSTKDLPFLKNVLIASGVSQDVGKTKGDSSGRKGPFVLKNACEKEPYTSEKMKNIEYKVLSEPCKLFDVDFNNPDMLEKIATGQFPPISVDFHHVKKGNLDAVITWFCLQLDAEGKYIINTEIGSDFCWDQAVYPVRQFAFAAMGDSGFHAKVVRLAVKEDDIVRVHFSVHVDRLQLDSLDRINFNQQSSKTYIQNLDNVLQMQTLPKSNFVQISLNELQIERCNDSLLSNLYFKAVSSFAADRKICILDMSNSFDWTGVKLCKVLADKVELVKYSSKLDTLKAYEHIANLNELKNLHFGKSLGFDIVLSDLIEPSGLLSPSCLFYIQKAQGMLKNGGLVIPKDLTVHAQCITSPELLNLCMVTSDENTLDLKISEAINLYRVSEHSHLDMHTLDYKPLTGTEDLLKVNLNQEYKIYDLHHSIAAKVTSPGKLHAILFWYSFTIFEDCRIDTSDPKNHWKQAAYILPKAKQFDVKEGDEIVIATACYTDRLLFKVSMYG